MTTSQLNSKLEIVKLKNVKFYNKKNQYVVFNGHALKIKGLGLIRYKESSNEQENEFKIPYYPVGKLKALKDILKGGGFLSYYELEFNQIKSV